MHTPRTSPDCKHPEGPGHDCAYVDARNSLIPTAEHNARRAVGVPLTRAEQYQGRYKLVFARAFLAEMDRLWAASQAGPKLRLVP